MRLTERNSGALVLIGFGLFMLFNVPAWFFTNVAAPPDQRAEIAQKIASLEDANRQTMIVGGVSLTLGALLGWRAWARPK